MRITLFFLFCIQLIISHAQFELVGESSSVSGLNTTYDENSVIMLDSTTLVFTRSQYPEGEEGALNKGNIWISNSQSENWSEPVVIQTASNEYIQTPIGAAGGYLYYNQVEQKSSAFKGVVYSGSILNNDLMNTKPLVVRRLRNKSPQQSGSISADGRHMVLSLESTVTFGVEDLYVTHLQPDGTWSSPKNLGYGINTLFQEITPFLAADNKTMFFATNGREGEGSFDLYFTERIDDTWQNWTPPTNLGKTVNTEGAESSFSFYPGSKYAYFISTQNSDGYGDIRKIEIKTGIEATQALKVDTVQRRLKKKKTFAIRSRNDLDFVAGTLTVTSEDTEVTFETEKYVSTREIEISDITMFAKARGFFPDRRKVTAAHFRRRDTLAIALEPLIVGQTIVLRNVLFHRGTSDFLEESEEQLEIMAEVMQTNPRLEILVKGHTDNRGDPVLNYRLSRDRVKRVRQYLIDKGISYRRIAGKGYGGNEPIASNETEETRRLNRRVEFTIVRN